MSLRGWSICLGLFFHRECFPCKVAVARRTFRRLTALAECVILPDIFSDLMLSRDYKLLGGAHARMNVPGQEAINNNI